MKTTLLCLAVSFISIQVTAINISRDSVSMGAEYEDDIYYKLDRTIAPVSVSNTNYHLAFSNMISQDDQFYTIWLNPTMVHAYVNPTQKITEWNNFSANNSENWRQLQNADTSWGQGGFARGKVQHPRYAWAKYTSNGKFNGDSLYLLKLYNPASQTFDIEYKLWLEQRLSDNGTRTWTFKIGKTDNSWDSTIILTDLQNSKGNFMYYDILNRKELVREPDTKDWDFVFTKYNTFTQNLDYTVTGLLSNYGVSSGILDMDITDPNLESKYKTVNFDHKINSIGYNWKEFVFSPPPGKFVLEQNKVRIIKKQLSNGSSDYYAIQFVRFDGKSTGKIVFDYAYLGNAINVDDVKETSLNIYPNPSNGTLNLPKHITFMQIYNMEGKSVYQSKINSTPLDISALPTGSYLLKSQDLNGHIWHSKIIKE